MQLLKPLAAAALAFSAFTASAVTVYDAAADFSTAANPSPVNGGVWSYGTTNGFNNNTFTLFADNSSIGSLLSWNQLPVGGDVPAVYKNNTGSPIVVPSGSGTASYAPNSIGFHPGLNNDTAVYRFTAPTTGLYSYNATAFAQDTHPTSTQVALVLPDNTLYTGVATSVSRASSFAASGTIDLTAGQMLLLEVGTAVTVTSTTRPAPSSPSPPSLSPRPPR